MVRLALVLGLWLGWAQMVAATSLAFDFTARIDFATLRPAAQSAKVPVGGTLHGRMTYSLTPSQRFGGDHLFDPGLESFTIWTDQGYRRTFDNRVTGIASTGGTDILYAQSFLSEDPNGWHLALNIAAKDWFKGRTDLPLTFPDTFEYAYLEVYKTDEGNRPQSIDATILSISPVAAVPVPPALGLLASALILTLGLGRARRRRPATA
jgi:hypothetical protein